MDDPDGVKALLDKLSSSAAWHQAVAASPAPETQANLQPADIRPAVASLLAQLADARADHPPDTRMTEAVSTGGSPAAEPPRAPITSDGHDLHAPSFQQALSHIARLSGKPGFIDSIRRIQHEQSALESLLWSERLAIQQKHQEKTKVAATKANLIGSGGLSQFEADTLTQAYKRELHKFDTQRVALAWDGLISKQQAALESLGVPAMYVTDMALDREKQERIVRVLESIVNGADH